MATFYLTFLAIGAVLLALQLALGLAGAADHGALDHDVHGADGLHLLSVRALSAAAAFFGVTGLGLMQLGLPGVLAAPVALVAGFGAAVGMAAALRAMKRLEQDRSFDLHTAIGLPATVSLGIPGARAGAGKVHLVAHDRFQEVDAVTAGDPLPSGTPVHVVDVLSSDTVVVSRTLTLLEDPA
jgi:Na+/glutamate symporter